MERKVAGTHQVGGKRRLYRRDGSGHAVVIDGPADIGGRNLGPRPMEMMLLSVGSCSAVDVVHILKKARQAVTDCVVEVRASARRPTRRFLPRFICTLS